MLFRATMYRLSPRLAASFLVLGALVAGAPAHADAVDPDVARITQAGHGLKWNWTPPGKTSRYGHAETLIHAPIAKVQALVLDFGHYTQLADSITTSRVVGHTPEGASDVYIQMGVLNNTIKLWNVTRFAPAQIAPDGTSVVDGQMVRGKGNIDDAELVWTMRPIGADWTVLKFDLLLSPGVPCPASLLDEQTRDSALDAVRSIQRRSQGSDEVQPYAG